MTADSYENILLLSEEAERRHLHANNELKAGIGTIESGFYDASRALGQKTQEALAKQGRIEKLLESHQHSHIENQITIIDDIRAIQSSLSEICIRDNQVRTNTIIKAPTEAAVSRVIRAELRRVLKPTIEQCLHTFKANSDDRIQSMLNKIDEMSELFGQELHETTHSCSYTDSQSRSEAVVDHECIQGDTKAMGLFKPVQTDFESSAVAERTNSFFIRRSKHQMRSKAFKWAIGTLRVTITSTHTISNVSYVGENLQSRGSYRIAIEFQPAEYLIVSRGFTLIIAHTQDQRGYYQVCPLLGTFAVVPIDADVMLFAEVNDVAGLQLLFQKGLAAPSDRDERGGTPLMVRFDPLRPEVASLTLF